MRNQGSNLCLLWRIVRRDLQEEWRELFSIERSVSRSGHSFNHVNLRHFNPPGHFIDAASGMSNRNSEWMEGILGMIEFIVSSVALVDCSLVVFCVAQECQLRWRMEKDGA